MFVAVGGCFGAVLGALIARRRKGAWPDILQYAFVYFLIFSLLGLFVTIFVHRAAI
ncbi:MAG: hypothetical protein AAF678_12470 [Pseudomonadota bacterium]